jgi:hypothetical protein
MAKARASQPKRVRASATRTPRIAGQPAASQGQSHISAVGNVQALLIALLPRLFVYEVTFIMLGILPRSIPELPEPDQQQAQ